MTGPRSNVTGCGYGAAGRQTQEIDGYGGPVAATATMIDDAGGNLLSGATGQSVTATYAHPSATGYGYDALNRQARQIDGYGTAVASTTTVL